jgi:hypothetical protein
MQGLFNINKAINIIQHINRIKGKDHVVIPTDAEKSFDEVQHPFTIKALKKVGIEGSYLNIIKTVYDLANIVLKVKNQNNFL